MENEEETISNIKHEPEMEYLLILPPATENLPPIFVKTIKEEPTEISLQSDSSFTCNKCVGVKKNFKSKRALKFHDSRNHREDEKRHSCRKCGQRFMSQKSYGQHIQRKAIIQCLLCDEKFKCLRLKEKHFAEVHKNIFACNQCSYVGTNGINLRAHKQIHEKKFSCETCDKKCVNNFTLNRHEIKWKHGAFFEDRVNVVAQFQCDLCNKEYKSKAKLLQHILRHVKAPCKNCYRLIGKYQIKKHKNEHHSPKVQCDLCSKKFNSLNILKVHLRKVHRNGEYTCSFRCNHKFKTVSELVEHNKTHIGLKKWKCLQCIDSSKTYFCQPKLKIHFEIRHNPDRSKEERKSCQLCGRIMMKRFLTTHTRRMHPIGEYGCEFKCRLKFKSIIEVVEHKKIHIGIKQWKCDKCSYKTTTISKMNRHIKSRRHEK